MKRSIKTNHIHNPDLEHYCYTCKKPLVPCKCNIDDNKERNPYCRLCLGSGWILDNPDDKYVLYAFNFTTLDNYSYGKIIRWSRFDGETPLEKFLRMTPQAKSYKELTFVPLNAKEV